jgi:hypothetical protein
MSTGTYVIAGLFIFAGALFALAKWQEHRQDTAAAPPASGVHDCNDPAQCDIHPDHRLDPAQEAHARTLANNLLADTDTVVLALIVDPLTERELLLAQADHGAESFAVNPAQFRETDDDVKARKWREQFDEALRDLDARFAEITSDLYDPLPSYWPSAADFDEIVRSTSPVTGAPVPTYLTPDQIAAVVGPQAVLEMIRHENEAPAVFSWTTDAYQVVPVSAPPTVTLLERPVDAPRPSRGRGRYERRR